MSWASPGRTLFNFDWETAYGTAPSAASAYTLPVEEESLGVDDAPIETMVLGNGNASQPARGNKDANGQIVVPVDLENFGFWLKLFLGAPTTTGSTAPYTHTYKYSTSALPSAIIDIGFPDATLYYKYAGCMGNTLAMSFGGNNAMSATINLLAKNETKGTSAYDGSATTTYLTNYTRLNNCDISAFSEGGGAVTNIETFNVTLDNRLDSSFGLAGSGWRTNCLRTKTRVTGNIVATFEDDSLLLKGRGNTESSLQVVVTSGTYSLTIKVPELKYSQKKPPTRGPAGLRQDLSFVGYYANDGDATTLKAILVNACAAATYA